MAVNQECPNQSSHQSCCGQTVKGYFEAADESSYMSCTSRSRSVMADNRCVVGSNLPSHDQNYLFESVIMLCLAWGKHPPGEPY